MNKIKVLVRNSPWVIALIYVVIGCLWIQYSDQWVLSLLIDPDSITAVQSLKGWFFVGISGFLIFFLIRKSNNILGEVIDQLQRANNKFKATIEHAPVGIAHHRPNEKWMEINQTLCKQLGYSREELMKLDFSDFIHPDDLNKGRELDRKLVLGEIEYYSIEKKYIRKDGSQFHGRVQKSAVYNGKNSPLYLVVVLEDITKEKETEKQIIHALKVKEILLSEVHHRVRNNLALISAFFDLQNMNTENKEVHEILNKNKVRIKCLAMVHETFSDSLNLANIKFETFLDQLIDFLSSTFTGKYNEVEIRKTLSPVLLNINLAIPVSLILTELMINTKPGKFDDVKQPVISISLREESGHIILTLSDNGNVIEKKNSVKETNTLTFTIIKALVTQVNGTLDTQTGTDGTTVSLRFKKTEPRGPGNSIYVEEEESM